MLATVCAYALMYVWFVHSALGNKGGRAQLVYEGTCCLAWGNIFDTRRDRGVVYVFFIFNTDGSLFGRRCVYTQTADIGYSNLSPGVGMRRLEGPNNPDGRNLGIYVFVNVNKVNMCMYMLEGGMRSLTNCFSIFHQLFFFFNTFFVSKRCKRKPPSI